MRYIIGIDLGTTNSCVSYVDTHHPRWTIQPFRIPQLVLPGRIEALPILPSFCYLSSVNEWPAQSLDLPWRGEKAVILGRLAQSQGSRTPTHLVQSAKSWLCYDNVNRRDKLLPFNASDEIAKISPLEATSLYLRHIKEAWNASFKESDESFEEQEIVLTVPASFDEVARTLTAEAAQAAGFFHLTLLEEPQAAFYSWIAKHEENWELKFEAGQTILVCDVGGGTTDFSLIEVTEKEGKKGFSRMAVGDHLLLGGDNMDAAIAHYLENDLKNAGYPECTSLQWMQLRHVAREVKEKLFSEEAPEVFPVHLQGTGSSVVRGSMSITVQKQAIHDLIMGGFFGAYAWDEALELTKASGIRSMGLPYEDDPSITKHLACFLKQSGGEGVKAPGFVLFNGGAMQPKQFQDAIIASLQTWFSGHTPSVLPTVSLDLAVSRGAAYYGKARRGMGLRIGGGAARGYYLAIEVQGETKALTLLPRGAEEGATYESDRVFSLKPNIPVSFYLYTSHVRLHDPQGEFVSLDPLEMHRLPPIHTILRYGKKQSAGETEATIPVHLQVRLTAIGTLEMWLKSIKTDHRWALEFQLRTATGQENSLALIGKTRQDETFDVSHLTDAAACIEKSFSSLEGIKQHKLMEELENILGTVRKEWAPSILRGLWPVLLKVSNRRAASTELDARFWNLAGFMLRPGWGYPLDDFRIKDLWKIILGDLKTNKPLENQIQCWICYRRIACGLSKGQQTQLANEILPLVFNKKSGKIEIKGKSELYAYSERIRTLASFENLEIKLKTQLGNAIVQRILTGAGISADYWAIARIGARHLLRGSVAHVVPSEIIVRWIEDLIKSTVVDHNHCVFVLEQLARKTDHREINVTETTVQRILDRFSLDPQIERLKKALLEGNQLSHLEQEEMFGEKLPTGLSLETL